MMKHTDPHSAFDEQAVLKGCKRNERVMQERLYRHFADRMFSAAMVYCKDHDTAGEVLQQAFIKVFRSIPSYSAEGSLEGWIRRIVVNTALEYLRKEQRELARREHYSDSRDLHVQSHISLDKKRIIELVNSLPEKAAMVLKLFAIEGYNHKEIALMMDISEGTSKSQLSRARQLLKEKMGNE